MSDHDKIIRKARVSTVEGDAMTYVMSDATVDNMGDIIEPDGWDLAEFRNNPVALFAHDSRFIVGKWQDVRVEKGRLLGRLELHDKGVSERINEIIAAVERGFLRAVSVGFTPVKYEPIDGKKSEGGFRFLKQKLRECSLVAVPANPNALAIAKELKLSSDVRSLIFGKSAGEDQDRAAGAIGKSALTTVKRTIPMTVHVPLSKRIEETQTRLNALRDQQTEHLANAGEDLDDAALAANDELNAKIEHMNKTLESLRKAEAMSAVKAEPIVASTSTLKRPSNVKRKEVSPGDYMIRAAVCRLLSKIQECSIDEVRLQRYGDDEPTKIINDLVLKTAVNPATTTTSGWAAELIATTISEFLDLLMPLSVYPALAGYGARFTFGRAGQVSIPSRATTPTIGGAFVSQGSPIPVKKGAFASVTLTPKKMGVISTFTREIAEHSTPSIEALIRQAIQEDTAVAVDTVLLDANAATTTRPAGLKNGVAATTATAGGGFTALVGDIKALIGVLAAANALRKPVWIMNPVQAISIALTQNAGGDFPFANEVNQGRLQGYPLIQSTTQTAGTVILLDAADFFSATGDEPRFAMSDTAVLHEEDTTPLAIGTVGSPNTVAAPTRSLWQTDTFAIRMLLDINWAMRRSGVIAWTQSVTW